MITYSSSKLQHLLPECVSDSIKIKHIREVEEQEVLVLVVCAVCHSPDWKGNVLAKGERREHKDGEHPDHVAGHPVVHLQLTAGQRGQGGAGQTQVHQDLDQLPAQHNQ